MPGWLCPYTDAVCCVCSWLYLLSRITKHHRSDRLKSPSDKELNYVNGNALANDAGDVHLEDSVSLSPSSLASVALISDNSSIALTLDTQFTANCTRSHATLFSLEESTAESGPRIVLYFYFRHKNLYFTL